MNKKNIAKILLAAMIFTGCNRPATKPIDPMITPEIIERDEAVKELPYDPVSLINYINENIEKVDKNKKQLYLFTLEDTLIGNLSIVGGVINTDECRAALSFIEDGSRVRPEDIEKISDKNIKNEIQKVYDMYYEIYRSGESFISNVDYAKILKLVDKDNKALKDYYSIKLEENEEPTIFKAVINLSPEELLARINRIENFVIEYKDFPRNPDFIVRYQSWLYLLLTGTTLSPLVDQDGNILKSYEDLAKKLEAKTIADQTFLDGIYLMKSKNNVFNDQLVDEIRNLVKQSVFELKDRAEMN